MRLRSRWSGRPASRGRARMCQAASPVERTPSAFHVSSSATVTATSSPAASPHSRRKEEQSSMTERCIVNRLLTLLPAGEAERLRHRLRRLSRPVRLGTLRPTSPISTDFGYDRGTPIDRYYIEAFLSHHRSSIRGHVLEV